MYYYAGLQLLRSSAIVRLLLFVCVLGVSFTVTGCAKKYPPIRATGIAYTKASSTVSVPVTPPPTVNTSWATGIVKAEGQAAFSGRGPIAQQRAMAKRGAVTVARRNLLEILIGTQIDSQTTVRDFVTESDVIRSKVDGLIRGAEVVSSKDEGDIYTVVVQLDRSRLATIISVQAPPPSSARVTASAGGRDPMAERAALLDGKRKIVEAVYGQHIQSSSSVTNYQLDYDRITSSASGVLRFVRQIGPARYSGGTCEVTVELDGPNVGYLIKHIKRTRGY